MNTQNNCCHHKDTINQVKFEHQIYKKVTLYVDVHFCGLSVEIYKCLLSSDWLGVLLHRSKVRCCPPCHATRWSEVVGTSLNSSLLLLRINQIRISILFIYLLHLLIFFYLILQWLQIYVIVPILIVKHTGYCRSQSFPQQWAI